MDREEKLPELDLLEDLLYRLEVMHLLLMLLFNQALQERKLEEVSSIMGLRDLRQIQLMLVLPQEILELLKMIIIPILDQEWLLTKAIEM